MAAKTLRNVTEFSDDTIFTADSVESNPVYDYIALGTYQLQQTKHGLETEQNFDDADTGNDDLDGPKTHVVTRIGSLSLYFIDRKENSVEIKRIQRFDKEGILDMKWSRSGRALVASCSTGCVSMFEFDDVTRTLLPQPCATVRLDSSRICMSVDWVSANEENDDGSKVVSCFTTGTMALMDLQAIQIVTEWSGHDYDAWIVTQDKFSPDIVYSGGDDCRLKTWDLRALARPTHINKSHAMGVCSIQGNRHREFIIASGSYDECINVWDTRYKTKPLCSIQAGGGVWRLKWHPHNADILLAACMHDGFKIFDTSTKNPQHLLSAYKEHDSLAYGADWCIPSWISDTERLENSLIATCSFYDHNFNVWRVENDDIQ
eukprot:gene3306-3791_t